MYGVNVEDIRSKIGNCMYRATFFSDDKRFEKDGKISRYTLRFSETHDELSIVVDEVIFTKEDEFVSVRKYDNVRTMVSWNKFQDKWYGYEYLQGFKLYREGNSYEEGWDKDIVGKDVFKNCIGDELQTVSDFVRRVIYLKNRNLFKVAKSELHGNEIHIIGYFDCLDVIESLCLQMSPGDVFLQMRGNALSVNSAKKLKSAIGLPIDIVKTLDEWNLGRHVADFQRLVAEKKAEPNDIRRLFDMFKAINKIGRKRKIGWGSFSPYYEIDRLIAAVDLGCPFADAVDLIAREALMYTHVFTPYDLRDVVRRLYDVYKMLAPQGTLKPRQNLEKWHFIVSRNNAIKKNSRAEEYTEAAKRINNASGVIGGYEIKCPETEDELFAIGEAYNNCLPTYRDRIIDEGAIIFSMYKVDKIGNIIEDIPSVTFEVTATGDFIQIKTFNDQDVDDPHIISILKEWRRKAFNNIVVGGKEIEK